MTLTPMAISTAPRRWPLQEIADDDIRVASREPRHGRPRCGARLHELHRDEPDHRRLEVQPELELRGGGHAAGRVGDGHSTRGKTWHLGGVVVEEVLGVDAHETVQTLLQKLHL